MRIHTTNCPVTKGVDTTMSQAGFERVCRLKSEEVDRGERLYPYCHNVCKNRTNGYQEELTFIDIEAINKENGVSIKRKLTITERLDDIRTEADIVSFLTEDEVRQALSSTAAIKERDTEIKKIKTEMLAAKSATEKAKMERDKLAEQLADMDQIAWDLAIGTVRGEITGLKAETIESLRSVPLG